MYGSILQTVIMLDVLDDISLLTPSTIERQLLDQLPSDSSLIRWAITQVTDAGYHVDVSYQLAGTLV